VYRARRALFGISLAEAGVERRGFHSTGPAAAERLERVGKEFLGGYHIALEAFSPAALADQLNARTDPDYRGFAFEGAAMAFTLLDQLHFTRNALCEFLARPGEPHVYMLHVGAGWAVARLPWLQWRLTSFLNSFDPLLRWLVVDGYGFHEGYFHWPASIRRHQLPHRLTGYAVRAFDHGLGRSLWFVEGMDLTRIASSIRAFPSHRHDDLWAGVGLACAYAGCLDPHAPEHLAELAGEHAPAAAQGAAFAAEARAHAGNPTAHCDLACRALCGLPAADAAAIAREARNDLPADGTIPAYEVWRSRIQHHFLPAVKGACQ